MADYDHEAGARAMFLALHDAFKEMGFVPVSSHFGGMLFKAALAEIERQQRAARKELTLADLQEPAAPDDLRMLSAYRTVPSITTDGTAAPVADVAKFTDDASLIGCLEATAEAMPDLLPGTRAIIRAAAAALTRLAGELDRITKGTYSLEIARLNKSHLDAEARAEAAERERDEALKLAKPRAVILGPEDRGDAEPAAIFAQQWSGEGVGPDRDMSVRRDWLIGIANGCRALKARAERAEADAKALREAWRGLSCPAPFATNRTKTAGECMDREQCGCENRAALAPREGEGR